LSPDPTPGSSPAQPPPLPSGEDRGERHDAHRPRSIGTPTRTPGLRLRPIPELGTCLAYTPSPPRLHTLNPLAWLIVELCDGSLGRDLQQDFLARSVPPLAAADALQQLQSGLAMLHDTGILYLPKRTDP